MRMPDKPTDEPRPEAYGPEVLCANWNPAAAAMAAPMQQGCRDLLTDVARFDGEAFLRQIYRSQRI
jgi:hypothetical protein